MFAALGANPKYQGWLALGSGGRGYGFLFETEKSFTLAAWMPTKRTDKTTTFRGKKLIIDSLPSIPHFLEKGEQLAITDMPLFIIHVPPDVVAQAKANASKPFPWGGDYTKSTADSIQTSTADGNKGIAYARHEPPAIYKFDDGSSGFHIQNNQATAYFVHPSLSDFNSHEYYIRPPSAASVPATSA